MPTEDRLCSHYGLSGSGPKWMVAELFKSLQVGDRVVTNGSFLLRAAWLKAR